MSVVPIPRLEGIAGPLKEITLHCDAVVCINIVLQLGVVIREVLNKRDEKRKRWKGSEGVRTKDGRAPTRKKKRKDRKKKKQWQG